MNQLYDFFENLLTTSDWPARWNCGKWSDFHGWLYIVSDLLIWSAYFAIPLVILKYIVKKRSTQFLILYLLFAGFILSCGLTHLLSAVAFWSPMYRLNALMLCVTGVISWVTVYYLIKLLPVAFSLRLPQELEFEILLRQQKETELNNLNSSLDKKVFEKTKKIHDYKYALDESCMVVVVDTSGIIVSANNYYAKMMECSLENLIGKVFPDQFQKHSDTMFYFTLMKALRSGSSWKGDLCIENKSGTIVSLASTLVPFTQTDGVLYQYIFTFTDLSVRVLAEKMLKEKNIQIKNILDRITDGFMSMDADLTFTYVNKKIGSIFSKSPQNFIGKQLQQEFPDTAGSLIFSKLKQAMADQKYTFSEEYYEPLDLWLENHIYPTRDGLSVFVRDITFQKLSALKLLQSERKFRGLIEHNKDIITLLDKNLVSIYRSPSSEKIIGKDFIKTTEMAEIHPEDKESVKKAFSHSLKQPGINIPLSFRFPGIEKKEYWLEGGAINLLNEQNIEAIVVNLQDVTKRKQAEELLMKSEEIYRTIASSIPGSLICILDLELRYLLIEGDLLEKLGYSHESLLGKKATDILEKDVLEEWKDNFDSVIRGETISKESNKNGFDLHTRLVPFRDKNNKVFSFMIISIDITELKAAQKQILEMNQNLEIKIAARTEELLNTNKELESFCYSVSHDLRSPLRSINGYAKIIQEEHLDAMGEETKKLFKIIENNAVRMGLLIDDLLSFSQLGRAALKQSFLAMNEITETVVEELQQQGYENARMSVSALHPAYADNALMKQVMINLISNALKYSSKNETPEISINSEINEQELVYTVADNGTGFNMDYAHKLFNVFQRLHSNKDFDGTGVGLAIVKRIVEKHGGKVWAEGKVNEGATFSFSLPLNPN